jgi:hypothetical protein
MHRWHGRPLQLFRYTLVTVLLVLASAGHRVPAMAQQSAETHYTSPTFGYSVAWPMPWYLYLTEYDGTFDTLVLLDDESIVQLSGAQLANETVQRVLDANVEVYRSDPDNTNFQQMAAGDCAYPSTGVAACYRYDLLSSDGSTNAIATLFESRALGDELYLAMIAQVPERFFADYLTIWREIAIAGPGDPVPTPATGNDWEQVEIDGADYRIEPGVSALDRDLTIEGIEFARRTVRAMAGTFSTEPLTVTVRSTASLRTPDQYGLTSRVGSIFIYTGSTSWPLISPIERLQGLVHEYFHIFQFDRMDRADKSVPAWFQEGSADAFGFLAVSQLGVTGQMDFIRLSLYRIQQFDTPGPLCSYDVTDGTFVPEVYSLGHLAIQELLARNGQSIEALVRVFEEIGDGVSFEDAFASTFHVSVDQFCADVEAWRTTLAPVDDYPADLVVYQGEDVPSDVAFGSVPAQAAPGQQVLITATTSAAANCALTMTADKRSGPIVSETFANGSGEAFWLLIVPENALPGQMSMEISCGAAPVSRQLTIT